jgi:hypothetical protein
VQGTTILRILPLLLLLGLAQCSELGLGDWLPAEKAKPVDQDKLAELNKFPYIQMAPDAPPPLKPEFRGRSPGNDEYTWRRGHWDYVDGAGFKWTSGSWLRKPAFSAVWSQDMWLQRTYGWTFVPGHWE